MPSMDYAHVADIYDSYVQATFDIPFFVNEAKKTNGDVLELMCGTGRVSIPLLEAGVRLTCVDSSPNMLELLHEKLDAHGLRAEVYEQDVCNLSLPNQYDLIFIPFHSFAEILTPEDQRQALKSIYRHLASSGRFICTLHNPAVRLKAVYGQLRLVMQRVLEDGQGSMLIWLLEHYDPSSRQVSGLEFIERYAANGDMQFRRMIDLRFAVITEAEFLKMAESAGFTVTALYGDYDCGEFHEDLSSFMIWELQR